MNNRLTLITLFSEQDLEKLKQNLNSFNTSFCKIPYGKGVENRELEDTLPFHLTLSTWTIKKQEEVIQKLSFLSFPPFKILIDDINIMNGAEDSLVLYYHIKNNKQLKKLQYQIYEILPNNYYDPKTFEVHITIHIDKEKEKIQKLKELLLKEFVPIELEVTSLGLYQIYPAILLQKY